MAKKDLRIPHNADWYSVVLPLVDANGNNITQSNGDVVTGAIRRDYTNAQSFALDVELNNNSIIVHLPRDTAAQMPVGRYVYDLLLYTEANDVFRIYEGVVDVTPGVTDEVIQDFANGSGNCCS